MPNPEEEKLLEQTKMSFGEHLEELRRALFKSLLALVVGTIAGFFVGMQIVDYVQGPLRKGLEDYYQRRVEQEQFEWLKRQRAEGRPTPEDLDAAAKELAKARLVPHDYYVERRDLAQALVAAEGGSDDQDTAKPPAAPNADGAQVPNSENAGANLSFKREDMVRLRLYQPMEEDSRMQAIALNTQEPFVVYMKASIATGLVLASPFIFYFIWEFVAAGLYKQERRYVHIYLPMSLSLFVAGATLAFYFAFDYMLAFLFWFHEKMHIDPFPRLSDWISTVVLLPLGFGVSFQLPLVMLMLERIGVFTVESYINKWRIAVVIIAVLAMLLTPGGDVGSMMIMFLPLVGLYFLGIFMCRHMPGAKPKASAA